MKQEKTTSVQEAPVEKNTHKRGYGLLSLMAMTIGIVIGSGIFARNTGLIASAGTVSNVIIAWVIGSLIVIAITIAFLEVLSTTEITGEQATITNWGNKLLGKRFGNFIGYYFSLVYYPSIMAALLIFASDYALQTLPSVGYTGEGLSGASMLIGMSIILLIIIGLINAFTIMPGKLLQNTGTAIKTLPLFFIVILFIYMITASSGDISFDNKFGAEYSSADNGNFTLILAAVPAILFSFDGFLSAGPLSAEAKSRKTFRMALVFSMFFIVIVYVLYSIAILGIGSTDPEFVKEYGGYGTISNAVHVAFAGNIKLANAISITANWIIVISVLTTASGCSIATARMLSDLSAQNAIRDENGKLITKNKYGVSQYSGLTILMMAFIFWFIYAVGTGIIANKSLIENSDGTTSFANGAMVTAGFYADLAAVLAFLIYAIIIWGAIINRFKKPEKRVPVKKNLLFIPAALIGSILMFSVGVWYGYQIIKPIFAPGADIADKVNFFQFIIFIILIVFLYVLNRIRVHKLSDEIIKSKSEQLKIYYGEDYNLNLIEISDSKKKSEVNKRKKYKVKTKNNKLTKKTKKLNDSNSKPKKLE